MVRLRSGWRLNVLLAIAAGLAFVGWQSGAFGSGYAAEARDAIASRNLDLAERHARNALKLAPTADNYLLLATALRKKGEIPEFADVLEEAKQAGADPFDVELEAALSYAQSGRIEEVEPLLTAAVESASNSAEEAYEAYVNGCLFTARLDLATTAISEWIARYPESANAHFYAGRLHMFYGQTEKARDSFETALAKRPDHCPAAYLLGTIAEDSNKYQEAANYFRTAAGLRFNAAARLGEARVLRSLGSADEARSILEELLVQNGETTRLGFKRYGERYEGDPIRRELGSLEVAAGNAERARSLLDVAVAEDPRDTAALQARGLALRDLGETELATKDLEAVRQIRKSLREVDRLVDFIGKNPEVVDERVEVGRIYLLYGSELTGEYWLKSALGRDPDCLEAHRLLADLYARWVDRDPVFRERAEHHRARISQLSS